MKGLKKNRWNQRVIAGAMAVLLTVCPMGQVAWGALSNSTATAASTIPAETMEISVQDAVDLAMKNNDNIKTAALNKENANLNRSIGQKQYAQSVVDGPQYSTFGQDATLYQLKIKDLQSDIYSLAYDYTKESVEVGIRQLYWNVLLQQSSIEAAESALAYAEKQYKAAQLKQTVGMLTQTSVSQAKASVDAAKATLTTAEGNLQTALNSLKKQMGVKENTELVLTEELPELTPIDISDLDYYVNKMVMNAPTLKIQDKTVEANEYGTKANKIGIITSGIGFTNPLTGEELGGKLTYSQEDQERQTEISTETAKITRDTTEKDLRDNVRSLYYDALSLESNYEAVKQAMLTAEAALETKQQMYDLGMATALDLLEAQSTCDSYKDKYTQVLIGHAIDALKLEHPWC